MGGFDLVTLLWITGGVLMYAYMHERPNAAPFIMLVIFGLFWPLVSVFLLLRLGVKLIAQNARRKR